LVYGRLPIFICILHVGIDHIINTLRACPINHNHLNIAKTQLTIMHGLARFAPRSNYYAHCVELVHTNHN